MKNRVIMACVNARYGSYGGQVTEQLRDFYAEIARGGVGLIVAQLAGVSPEGQRGLYNLALWDDRFILGMRELAGDIHAGGAGAAIQISHSGASAQSCYTGTRPVAPSSLGNKGGEEPRALTLPEIARLVESFAQAARRARDAGFDMVEIQAAHGYLINQFLSPLWNQRQDQYGGSYENRTRFLREVIARTRELVGSDFPLMVRLGADDFVPGGLTLEDGCRTARLLEAGGVDLLNVSGGIGETFSEMIPSSLTPPGNLVHLAAAVRREVGIPVAAVGKLHRPELAESVLAEGKADLIALSRALLADPHWPTKAAEGRWDEIRPCLACVAPACHGRTLLQMDLGCMVNPTVGREGMFPSPPVEQPKRVMVIGGGPAGIEAALAASGRGHQVTLYERASELGGQIPLAAAPPYKEEMGRYLRYLQGAIARSSVRVVLGTEVEEALVERERPEVVILATGATPTVLDVPIRDQQAATAWEILGGQVEAGEKVVVVGGAAVGCETAEFLAARGKRVTILEMLPEVATELTWWNHDLMLKHLAASDVHILTNSRLVSAEGGTITYERRGMTNKIRGVDTLVLAVGVTRQDGLGRQLRERGYDVRPVGDSVQPGNLGWAVRSGFEAGSSI